MKTPYLWPYRTSVEDTSAEPAVSRWRLGLVRVASCARRLILPSLAAVGVLAAVKSTHARVHAEEELALWQSREAGYHEAMSDRRPCDTSTTGSTARPEPPSTLAQRMTNGNGDTHKAGLRAVAHEAVVNLENDPALEQTAPRIATLLREGGAASAEAFLYLGLTRAVDNVQLFVDYERVIVADLHLTSAEWAQGRAALKRALDKNDATAAWAPELLAECDDAEIEYTRGLIAERAIARKRASVLLRCGNASVEYMGSDTWLARGCGQQRVVVGKDGAWSFVDPGQPTRDRGE